MMAANSNVLLARLCEQLVNLYDVSTIRRKQNERVVRDCRELLKPWPKKKDVQSAADSNAAKTSNANLNLNSDTTESTTKKDDAVPEAERAALALAEKALAQAQRFIQKQAKVIERESNNQQELQENSISEQHKSVGNPAQRESSTSKLSNKSSVQKPARSGAPCQTGSAGQRSTRAPGQRSGQGQPGSVTGQGQRGQTKTQADRSGSGKRPGSSSSVNGEVGVISQSTLKKALSHNVNSNNRSVNNGNRTGTNSSVSSNRPPVVSARTSHRPAHMAAPFRTQAPAPRVKNRPTRASELRQGRVTHQQRTSLTSASQSKVHQDRGHSGHIRTASAHRCKPDDASVHDDEVLSQRTVESLTISSPDDDAHPQPQMQWMTEEELVQEANNINLLIDDRSSSIKPLTACEQVDGASNEVEPPAEPPAFELLSDGNKITLPPKLKKAMAQNNKLRHQLETAALTFHASRDNSPTSSFLNKLTEHYDARTSEEYKDAVQMLALYKRLTALMDKLHGQKCDDDSTWQQVLRTKRTMENVCLMYADMEENYLHQVQGSVEDMVQHEPTLTVPDIQPTAVWLPLQLQHDSLSLRPALQYRKLRDAERYISLLHEAQVQMLNLHIMDLAADTLLPLLRKMDSSHSSFRPLYRAVYSLLCESARRQPIIISDIPDDESS